MLRSVALVRTDISEERIASIIRVTQIGEIETTITVSASAQAVANVVLSSPIIFVLLMQATGSSEALVLTRATRCNIPEYGIPQSNRRKTL
jgi:hypothetical protein